MDEWVEEFRAELLCDEPIKVRTLARIIQSIHPPDPRDITLASELTSVDLVFLARSEIEQIISADLTETQIITTARESEERYSRICDILPSILGMLSGKTNFCLRYTISRLDDLARDFSLPSSKNHRIDKVRNQKLKSLRTVADTLHKTLRALEVELDDYLFAEEYRTQVWAENWSLEQGKDKSRADVRYPVDIESLIRMLELALTSIEIEVFDTVSSQPRQHLRSYQMGKRDIVSFVYDLHNTCGGPPLVTTPGSDFSYLCSLIYEMATGEPDQSFAGAIIAFSKSREKHDEDEHQSEVREDRVAIDSDDNFYLVKKSIKALVSRAIWYMEAAQKNEFAEKTTFALTQTALAYFEAAAQRKQEFGPFIVWADQEPEEKREGWRKRLAEQDERMRQSRIELGRLRRQQEKLVDPK